jgi:DNA invertase Pin-like site-specific DNA recombinase
MIDADMTITGVDGSRVGDRYRLITTLLDHHAFARMFLQILAVVAEFEANLIKQRTREGMAIARSKGKLRGKQPKLKPAQGPRGPPHARQRRLLHRRDRRDVQRLASHRVPGAPALTRRQRHRAPRPGCRPARR